MPWNPWDFAQLLSVRCAYTSDPCAFPYKKPAGDILTTDIIGHSVRHYVDKKGVRCANIADLAALFGRSSADSLIKDALELQTNAGPCASHAICRAGDTADDLYLADPYLTRILDSYFYGFCLGVCAAKVGYGKEAYAAAQSLLQQFKD